MFFYKCSSELSGELKIASLFFVYVKIRRTFLVLNSLMPLIPYLNRKFEYSHENHGFQFLIEKLPEIIPENEEWAIVGNFSTGNDNDALLIKNDAIVLIEMKNYSGILLSAKQNGDWQIETTRNGKPSIGIIAGGAGRKNPFEQIKLNQQQFYLDKLKILDKKHPNFYSLIFFHGLGEFSIKEFSLPYSAYSNDKTQSKYGNNKEGTFHVAGRNTINEKVKNDLICHTENRWSNEQIKKFVETLGVKRYQEHLFKEILEFNGYYGRNDPKIELISGEVNGPIRKNDKVYISVYHFLQYKGIKFPKREFDTEGLGGHFSAICNNDFISVTYKLTNGTVQTTQRYDYDLILRNKEVFKKYRLPK